MSARLAQIALLSSVLTIGARPAPVAPCLTAGPMCTRWLNRDGVVARDLLDVLDEATRPAPGLRHP